MNNKFTLATTLFGKLKKCGINYRFKNGVYNPEEIIITKKIDFTYNIASVRSIPNSESTRYEIRWTNVPSYILADLMIDRVKEYEWSDELIIDILRVEKELDSIKIRKDLFPQTLELPTIRGVDVIFNDPATIVIWADGSKTVVKAENEKFDPEKGLAMAISKKVLGNKHDYYDVFKRYVGRYEKKQNKKAKKNK